MSLPLCVLQFGKLSESCTSCGRSRVITRISMGGALLGKRLRYIVSQCPFVNSSSIAELQQVATMRRVGEVGCKPEFLQVLAAFCASDAIPSIQQIGRSTIRIEHFGGGRKVFDLPPGCLTAVAIAGGTDNRSATSLEHNATAGACRGQSLWRTYRPTRFPHSILRSARCHKARKLGFANFFPEISWSPGRACAGGNRDAHKVLI